MHSHSFGDFLLENNYITSDQFIESLQLLNLNSRPSFEVCGLYDRTVTYETFESLMSKPEYPEMSIKEIAKKYKIITDELIEREESKKRPLFVSLAEILLKKGYLSYRSCQEAFIDYESESELYEFDADEFLSENAEGKINFLSESVTMHDTLVTKLFFKLMFENLYDNVGHDFTVLDPFECNEYPSNIMVAQDILYDDITYTFAIDLNEQSLLGFAERFSDIEFKKVDDYAIASLEDFINLHNGIFNVNLSNDYGLEANLTPPRRYMGDLYAPKGKSYMMPIVYPFGVLNLIFTTFAAEDEIELPQLSAEDADLAADALFAELGIDLE